MAKATMNDWLIIPFGFTFTSTDILLLSPEASITYINKYMHICID